MQFINRDGTMAINVNYFNPKLIDLRQVDGQEHPVFVYAMPGMVGLALKWVRLAPNGTNPGIFQIRFQCIWRGGAKCTEF